MAAAIPGLIEVGVMSPNRRDFWLYFVVIAMLATGTRLWQNHLRAIELQQWREHQAEVECLAWVSLKRMEWLQIHYEGAMRSTVHTVMKRDNLQFHKKLNSASEVWIEPRTGRRYRLLYEQDRWTTFTSRQIGNLPASPRAAWHDRITETMRQIMVRWGPMLWLLLLTGALVTRLHRSGPLDGMLAMAGVYLLARLLEPADGSLPPGRNCLPAMVMLLISSGGCIHQAFNRLRRGPTCLYCRYSLQGNQSGCCPECGVPVPESLPVDTCRMVQEWLKGAVIKKRPAVTGREGIG